MLVAEIEDLRHQRAASFERMKELNDAAEAESRNLTAEESQEYDRVEGEFDSLSERITRSEKLMGVGLAGSKQRDADELRANSTWNNEEVEDFEAKPEIRDLREIVRELADQQTKLLGERARAEAGGEEAPSSEVPPASSQG